MGCPTQLVSSDTQTVSISLVCATLPRAHDGDRVMTAQSVRLKVLLRKRHWQSYRTFCAEYDKVARSVDPRLIGTAPSRAQLHRWLSGELKGLPYGDHCRILEKMFPGWSADQL